MQLSVDGTTHFGLICIVCRLGCCSNGLRGDDSGSIPVPVASYEGDGRLKSLTARLCYFVLHFVNKWVPLPNIRGLVPLEAEKCV
jgi:hypothetical protein